MHISFQKTFYLLASTIIILLGLHYAKPFLIPLATALLLSFILFPLAKKLESFGIGRLVSAFVSIAAVILVILGAFYLFSTQIISLISETTEFKERLSMVFEKSINFLNNKIPIIPPVNREQILDQSQQWLKESGIDFMSDTLVNTAGFLSGLLIITIYTFLLLIYRSGLVKVFVSAADGPSKPKVREMISEVQKVGQNYLFGMGIIMLILGTANSIMLLLFGIDHPFLFGFFAGIVAIIPYVGTAVGGMLPVLFALITEDSIWIPIGIAISFWGIQTIEGNFLSPKIVGGNMNINALAAIASLVIGGFLWGIAGMALFLPLAAILKVVCSYFEELEPISLLLGDELYESKSRDKLKKIRLNLKKLTIKRK